MPCATCSIRARAASEPSAPRAAAGRQIVGEEVAAVLVVVAVRAQVLPVRAVGWIVVVVAVPVVDGQQVEVRGVELARALRADPPVQLERARAVVAPAL